MAFIGLSEPTISRNSDAGFTLISRSMLQPLGTMQTQIQSNPLVAVHKLKPLAVVAALLIPTTMLQAEEKPWEFRIFGGFDQTLTSDVSFGGASGDLDLGAGFASGAAVGYRVSDSFSLELEYVWRRSGEGDAPDFIEPGASLDVASVTISPTLWYHPPALSFLPKTIKPRVGVGYGWLQEVSMDLTNGGAEEDFTADGGVFQIMAGLDWEISPRWTLGFDMRYYNGGSIDAISESTSSRKLKFDYSGISFNVGASFRF